MNQRNTCGMEIRETVLAAMQRRRMSRSALARALEADGVCSASTVHRWLSGRGDVRTAVAEAAMRRLGVGVDDPRATWGSARVDGVLRLVVVGSHEWMRAGSRVAHGRRDFAEKCLSERLKALTRFGR